MIEVWTLTVNTGHAAPTTTVHASLTDLADRLIEEVGEDGVNYTYTPTFDGISNLVGRLDDLAVAISFDSHQIDLAPPLFTYADLSTGHLPQTEMDTITLAPVTVWEHEYGAWVNVPPAEFEGDDDEWDESNLPNLRKVIAWARERGARWINFDRDGDTVPDLPTWEW